MEATRVSQLCYLGRLAAKGALQDQCNDKELEDEHER